MRENRKLSPKTPVLTSYIVLWKIGLELVNWPHAWWKLVC